MIERVSKLKPHIFIFLFLVSHPSRATTYIINNNSDPGIPSNLNLRNEVTTSNAAGGTNTIFWSGTGGEIDLASPLIPVNEDTTFDVSDATAAVTIAQSTIGISGMLTLKNTNVTQPFTISSIIADVAPLGSTPGSLNLTSSGTFVLTGINLYTGGTTVSSATLKINSDFALGAQITTGSLTLIGGATVQAEATFISTRTINLGVGGGAFDTFGSTIALNGVIGDAAGQHGSLTVLDSSGSGIGTLYLTSANSYSSGTYLNSGILNVSNNLALGTSTLTFNGGKLQTGTSITLANKILINSGGGTIDIQGNNSALSGVISGSGSLTLISTGTLKLTNANTYTGGTNLTNGTINITNNSSLGTGVLTMGGGLLQFGANNVGISNNISLNVAVSSIDTQGFNSTVAGQITGIGMLQKIGAGILTLSNGSNNYSGGTIVNSGTLALGANNAVSTAGDLTVNPGATFNMGTFKQTLGSFNAVGGGGTLQLIAPSTPTAANLTVTGAANLAGTTLNAGIAPQLVANGQQFNAIAYGSHTSTFTAIISPASFVFTPTYNANSLVLTATYVPYQNIAVTPNQAAVANVLEPFRFANSGDILNVIANLNTLSTPQLQAAFDQIGPIAFGSMSGLTWSGATVQSASVSQRMTALADGSSRGGLSSYNVTARSPSPGDLLASAGTDDMGNWQPGTWTVGPESPWGFFTSGILTTGKLNEANSSAGVQPGYNFSTGGLTAGADYRISENFAAGLSGGYLHGHASVYSPTNGTVDNNSARYGVYATFFDENFHANLYVGGAADFFTTSRSLSFGALSRTATASPRGSEFNVDPSVSYDITAKGWGIFTPFAGLDYDRLRVNSFTESGADSLDLSVGPQTAETLESNLGIRFSEKLALGSNTVIPFASLGWRHEFENQSRSIDAQLAAGGATQFSINTGNYAQNGTLLGLGVSGSWSQNITTKFEYTGDFRSHYFDNMLNAIVRWKF